MNEHQIEHEKYVRFFKAVDDIQSMHKAEIAGNLSDYFIAKSDFNLPTKEYVLRWGKDPGSKIKNAVQNAVDELLNSDLIYLCPN
jgi:hypothetical protein